MAAAQSEPKQNEMRRENVQQEHSSVPENATFLNGNDGRSFVRLEGSAMKPSSPNVSGVEMSQYHQDSSVGTGIHNLDRPSSANSEDNTKVNHCENKQFSHSEEQSDQNKASLGSGGQTSAGYGSCFPQRSYQPEHSASNSVQPSGDNSVSQPNFMQFNSQMRQSYAPLKPSPGNGGVSSRPLNTSPNMTQSTNFSSHLQQQRFLSGQTISQPTGPTPTLNQLLQSSNPVHRYQNNYIDYSMPKHSSEQVQGNVPYNQAWPPRPLGPYSAQQGVGLPGYRPQATMVAFLWMEESSQVRVREDFGLATDTVVAWYAYFRDVAYKVAWHDLGTIGGPGDVVEVDETHLFKRKYNVGRITMWHDVWLFGGISRATRKVFGTIVPNRKRNALLPIMDRSVDHESCMCSDEYRPYFILPRHFNGAGRVNHSIQFIRPTRDLDPFWYPAGRFNPECLDLQWVGPHPDPVPLGFPAGSVLVPFRIHTQNIENAWKWLKSTVAKSTELDLTEKYVGEWMYRKNILETITHKSARFQRFLNDLSRAYPGIGKVGMSDNLMDCVCHECV